MQSVPKPIRRNTVIAHESGVIEGAPAVKSSPTPAPTPEALTIPEIARWESQMKRFGAKHFKEFNARYKKLEALLLDPKTTAQMLSDHKDFNELLAMTYYDFGATLYRIALYTGDPVWKTRAKQAVRFFRDHYVQRNNGFIPGFWNFTEGMLIDFKETGDPRSQAGVVLAATNAAYARDDTPVSENIESPERSREVAYTIIAYLSAEKAGEQRRERLAKLVDVALGHIDQWTGKKPWNGIKTEKRYVPPFMAGLTARALIEYHAETADARILPALKELTGWLWENAWVKDRQAFVYAFDEAGKESAEPAPDLNLLIAPAFAWVYKQTNDTLFAERADDIFAGGVRQAFMENAKQFNQNYTWSFDYVRWRK